MLLKKIRNESEEALEELIEGNIRFKTGEIIQNKKYASLKRMADDYQAPFAAIVGCSDSRAPIEIIFDQLEFGKLFVLRNAGNVVGSTVFGSLEYAVEHLRVPLIVVLGHNKCGAVKAAAEEGKEVTTSLNSIISKIKPAVDIARREGLTGKELYERAEDLNIQYSVLKIKQDPIIRSYILRGKLMVVGAKYELETGEVKFFIN